MLILGFYFCFQQHFGLKVITLLLSLTERGISYSDANTQQGTETHRHPCLLVLLVWTVVEVSCSGLDTSPGLWSYPPGFHGKPLCVLRLS